MGNFKKTREKFKKSRDVVEKQQTKSEDLAKIRSTYESEHPTSGITPKKAAEYLKLAEDGDIIKQCELAEDFEEKDSHLQAELGKRKRALQELSFRIIPPLNPSDSEKKDVEFLNEIFDSLFWLDDCVYDATDAVLKGFSCQEFTGWEDANGLILPTGVEWTDPALFQINKTDKNQLVLRSKEKAGAELQPFNWIVHKARSKSGYLARTGLIRTLVFPFIFKNYSVRDLAEFLEIYGIPMRVGSYPSGATEREKNALLQAVLSVGHRAGGIIPRSMAIDFQQAASGSSDPFLAMMSWAELSMSKAILGGTLTSQADGASSTNALGNVHNEVRFEVRNSDAKQLAATLTRDLVAPIYALNCSSFTSVHRLPRFEFDVSQPEDLGLYAQALPALVGIGMKIPSQWAHEKLQIPAAVDDEPVLKLPPVAAPAYLSTRPNNLSTVALTAQRQQDGIDDLYNESVDKTLTDSIDPLLAPIIEILQRDGFEAAKLEAAKIYSEMDGDQLTEVLSRALFVADLWGRVNA